MGEEQKTVLTSFQILSGDSTGKEPWWPDSGFTWRCIQIRAGGPIRILPPSPVPCIIMIWVLGPFLTSGCTSQFLALLSIQPSMVVD